MRYVVYVATVYDSGIYVCFVVILYLLHLQFMGYKCSGSNSGNSDSKIMTTTGIRAENVIDFFVMN